MSKGWIQKNCSCNGGPVGPYGDECRGCNGFGQYFIHLKSGVEAMYPGGPLLGKLSKGELKEITGGNSGTAQKGQ